MNKEIEPRKESELTCHGCGQTIDIKNPDQLWVRLREKGNDKEIPYHFDCLKRKVALEEKRKQE